MEGGKTLNEPLHCTLDDERSSNQSSVQSYHVPCEPALMGLTQGNTMREVRSASASHPFWWCETRGSQLVDWLLWRSSGTAQLFLPCHPAIAYAEADGVASFPVLVPAKWSLECSINRQFFCFLAKHQSANGKTFYDYTSTGIHLKLFSLYRVH